MGNFYILDADREPVEVDALTWALWFDHFPNRRVARTKIGPMVVSTVFMGMNHSYYRDSPPLLYETMVFGSDEDEKGCYRTYTWDGAVAQHNSVVAFLSAGVSEEEIIEDYFDESDQDTRELPSGLG